MSQIRLRSRCVRFAVILAVLLPALLVQPLFGQETMKEWKLKNGRKLTAEFVSREGQVVTFRDKSGKTHDYTMLQIDSSHWGEIGQLWVQQQQQRHQERFQRNISGQPLPNGGMGGTAGNRMGSQGSAIDLGEELKPSAELGWSYTPGEVPSIGRWKTVPLDLKNLLEAPDQMAMSPEAGLAVMKLGKGAFGRARIVVADLKKGKVTTVGTLGNLDKTPLAVNESGTTFYFSDSQPGAPAKESVEIYTIEEGDFVKQRDWVAVPHRVNFQREVVQLEAVGDRVIALGQFGRLVVWDTSDERPICFLDLANGAKLAVSPDRQVVAYFSKGQLGLLDPEKGELTSSMPLPEELNIRHLQFSPSGNRLIGLMTEEAIVWDARTGEQEHRFAIPAWGFKADVPSDNHLMLGGRILFDIDNQMNLWRYEDVHLSTTVGNATLLVGGGTLKQPESYLVAARLPHKEAETALEDAMKRPELFCVRPGSTVQVDVSGIPGADQQRVREQLTQALEANGNRVGTSNVTLVARLEAPEQTQLEFLGRWGTLPATYHRTVLQFKDPNGIAWQKKGSNIGGFVVSKPGETLPETVQRLSRGPNMAFFEKPQLPKYVQWASQDKKAGSVDTLGISYITPRGFSQSR